MTNTVKRKIRSGTIFLFVLLIILGGVSIFHIIRLQTDSEIILKNNYESLDYGHQMLASLDSFPVTGRPSLEAIKQILSRQEKNITEAGEENATRQIRSLLSRIERGDSSAQLLKEMRAEIYQVLKLNMRAIESKNDQANITANTAVTYITLLAAIVFLIGLTFTYNFPAIVSGPINALTEGIAEISAKNYGHRIHLKRNDEFGQMATAFNSMAERLEYFENSNLNKIIFEKTRAEAVINSLKDASIGIDKSEIILFANDQALQLLGLRVDAIVGRPASEVAAKNDLFRFLLDDSNGMPFKVVVDGKENYFIKEMIDITRDGTASRVIVLKNITSFKELDVAKNNFIATISHELKTPLASSDFSLKLLEDRRIGTLTGEQRELVGNLRKDNQRMLRILSELLNISQVEAGKIELDIQPVAAHIIADNAIEAVVNTARERNISIVKGYEDNDRPVLADRDKTTWVLNNLLTNAIKYSKPDSSVKLQLKQVGTTLQFIVTDEGPGISAEYHTKLFDRFFKVPGSVSSGSGLGLTISKEFIEAQNGRIWVESEPGTGSTFIFSLPLV